MNLKNKECGKGSVRYIGSERYRKRYGRKSIIQV